jgi:hypothetical protein
MTDYSTIATNTYTAHGAGLARGSRAQASFFPASNTLRCPSCGIVYDARCHSPPRTPLSDNRLLLPASRSGESPATHRHPFPHAPQMKRGSIGRQGIITIEWLGAADQDAANTLLDSAKVISLRMESVPRFCRRGGGEAAGDEGTRPCFQAFVC